MPRLTACRASSLCDQWLIGTSSRSGSSQASAMIWQICSAVNTEGAPLRGSSLKRSMTPLDASALSHRSRHWRAVLRQMPSTLAYTLAGSRRQDDACSLSQLLPGGMRPRQIVQNLFLSGCQLDRRGFRCRHGSLLHGRQVLYKPKSSPDSPQLPPSPRFPATVAFPTLPPCESPLPAGCTSY